MLADAQLDWVLIARWAIVAASLGLLGWGILRLLRLVTRRATLAQQHLFDGLTIQLEPARGLVLVVFHTYHGFIEHCKQTEHRFWAAPDDARCALKRLHRFNQKWGLLTRYALFIPALSFGNYLAQLRSIRKQERQFATGRGA